jgi:hypothetical protein
MESKARSSEQRPYTRPQLISYGDISQVTRNVGTTSSKPDGAGGQVNKTG